MDLIELKKNVNNFQLVQCGLYHEKVALDKQTNLPIKMEDLGTNEFQRVKLCNSEDRNHRLGCSHSIAGANFNSILDELIKADKSIETIKKEFNSILLSIYLLDHQTGNLEKKHAEIHSSTELNETLINEVEEELKSCRKLHSNHINELELIRKSVIERIEQLQ